MFRVNLSSYQFTYLFSFFQMIVLRLFVVLYIFFFKSHFVTMSVFLLFNFFTQKIFRAGVKLTQNTNQHIPPPSTPPNSFLKTYLTFSTILLYGPPKNMFCSHSSQKKFSLN